MPAPVTMGNPRDAAILQHLASCPFSTTFQVEKHLDVRMGSVLRALLGWIHSLLRHGRGRRLGAIPCTETVPFSGSKTVLSLGIACSIF